MSKASEIAVSEVECTPCDVAAAVTAALGVCHTFSADGNPACSKLSAFFENPDKHTVSEALTILQELRDNSTGEAMEQFNLLLHLAKGGDE